MGFQSAKQLGVSHMQSICQMIVTLCYFAGSLHKRNLHTHCKCCIDVALVNILTRAPPCVDLFLSSSTLPIPDTSRQFQTPICKCRDFTTWGSWDSTGKETFFARGWEKNCPSAKGTLRRSPQGTDYSDWTMGRRTTTETIWCLIHVRIVVLQIYPRHSCRLCLF